MTLIESVGFRECLATQINPSLEWPKVASWPNESASWWDVWDRGHVPGILTLSGGLRLTLRSTYKVYFTIENTHLDQDNKRDTLVSAEEEKNMNTSGMGRDRLNHVYGRPGDHSHCTSKKA